MNSRMKISILLHQKDSRRRHNTHLIWGIARFWKEMGFRVEVLRGISGSKPQTDLLVPHIDLTRVPAEYIDYMTRVPHVLNQGVIDISKRRISGNLLSSTDSYEAPVIVKTDKNCGGFPELRMSTLSRIKRRLSRLAGIGSSPFTANSNAFVLEDYPIFPNLAAVPAEVWSNPELVVEKFIPERREEYYGIQVCLFLGNVILNRRLLSRSPIIKGLPDLSETIDAPDELLEIRKRLGFDYGKLDYVVHQGKVHIIDANKTPGILTAPEVNASICGKLAKGVLSYLEQSR
jgi:hypothetical protein